MMSLRPPSSSLPACGNMRCSQRPNGFILPLVLILIALTFGAWALMHAGVSASIRQEQVRVTREARVTWSARCAAKALRSLQTMIATNPELGKVVEWEETVVIGDESRVFSIEASRLMSARWELDVAPIALDVP